MERARQFMFMAAACFLGLSARGAEPQGGFFDVVDENDAWSNFFGQHQDRHYTHGIKFDYMRPEHALDETNTIIPLWGIHDVAASHGYVLGQNMYTPQDILDPNPIPSDRPYAGWLYTGLVYQRRGQFTDHIAVLENFEINFGKVRPQS
jgi:hypothetical protein